MQGIPEGQWSDALHQAVLSLIQDFGITVIVAAGNSRIDSCTIVPANVDSAITVAAMDIADKFEADLQNTDVTYSWTNTGQCISLFAPGVDIFSACGGTGMLDNHNLSHGDNVETSLVH